MKPIELYTWQREALSNWKKANYRGMIEAVTGSGKTRVAIAALQLLKQQRKRGLHTLVVVPSTVLQEQWHKLLCEYFPDHTRLICRIGGGHKEEIVAPLAYVAVINSVAKKVTELLGFTRHGDNKCGSSENCVLFY